MQKWTKIASPSTSAGLQLDPHQYPACNENYTITCAWTENRLFSAHDEHIPVLLSVAGGEAYLTSNIGVKN